MSARTPPANVPSHPSSAAAGAAAHAPAGRVEGCAVFRRIVSAGQGIGVSTAGSLVDRLARATPVRHRQDRDRAEPRSRHRAGSPRVFRRSRAAPSVNPRATLYASPFGREVRQYRDAW
jgi:hypothetical protein